MLSAAREREQDPLDPIHHLVARVAHVVHRRDHVSDQPLCLLSSVHEVLGALEQLMARIPRLGDPIQELVDVLVLKLLSGHLSSLLASLTSTGPADRGPCSGPRPPDRTSP